MGFLVNQPWGSADHLPSVVVVGGEINAQNPLVVLFGNMHRWNGLYLEHNR